MQVKVVVVFLCGIVIYWSWWINFKIK